MICIGFVLAAGVFLITGNSPEYPPNVPDTAVSSLAETPFSGDLPPDPSQISAPVSPASGIIPDIKPEMDFSHLQLIGTAIDLRCPYAIILNEKTAQQGLFRPGDLVDGVMLEGIFAEKAILKYSAQRFTLTLVPGMHRERELVVEPSMNEESPDYVLSPMEQANIEKVWEKTCELMNQIELSQYEENNEPNGVTVDKVVENSVFEKIGLRRGDIILRVDDMAMSIADDAMEIYNCLIKKETAVFTVRRNGEIVTLNYIAINSVD
jgi:type II secretion system protein C